MTAKHSTDYVSHPEDVLCVCGHTVTRHGKWGCDAYTRPEIGGAGACCTRTAAAVLDEAEHADSTVSGTPNAPRNAPTEGDIS